MDLTTEEKGTLLKALDLLIEEEQDSIDRTTLYLKLSRLEV